MAVLRVGHAVPKAGWLDPRQALFRHRVGHPVGNHTCPFWAPAQATQWPESGWRLTSVKSTPCWAPCRPPNVHNRLTGISPTLFWAPGVSPNVRNGLARIQSRPTWAPCLAPWPKIGRLESFNLFFGARVCRACHKLVD